MPPHNNFEHAPYSRADPGDRVAYRELIAGAAPDSAAWRDAMGQQGRRLADARVRAVLFLHGSVLGTDLFGSQRLEEGVMKRGYSRGIPGLDSLLALMREKASGLPAVPGGTQPPFPDDDDTKRRLDQAVQDTANFSTAYVELFSRGINQHRSEPLPCRRILWSSEHHHLGRAVAACRLAATLKKVATELALRSGDRLLIVAHGHAGQVLALLSNLLHPQSRGRQDVLELVKPFVEPAHLALLEPRTVGALLNGAALDVVTLGTPVRHGWETETIGKLLHVVNHRPSRLDGKRWLAKMDLPQITVELPYAMGGDYVQQLAIAGTDAMPKSADAQAANKGLWEILEPYEGFERWLECARKGVRCPADGLCFLVDYKDGDTTPTPTPARHVFGHAAYTRLSAMLFTTTEIVQTLYAA